jgi:hypothetical protein
VTGLPTASISRAGRWTERHAYDGTALHVHIDSRKDDDEPGCDEHRAAPEGDTARRLHRLTRASHAGARTFRDRLTGRTPRSERGDRGSTPCPGVRSTPVRRSPTGGGGLGNREVSPAWNTRLLSGEARPVEARGRVAQWESARLTNERVLVRAQPRPCLCARRESAERIPAARKDLPEGVRCRGRNCFEVSLRACASGTARSGRRRSGIRRGDSRRAKRPA